LALRRARVTETGRAKVGIEKEKEMNDSVKGFEQYADVAREEFPAPIGKLLGLTIIGSGIGRATVEFEATGRYANPMGTLHGGVLCDVADAAMGVAYRSTLAEGETFTTIELKINFIVQSGRRSFTPKRKWFAPAGPSASSNATLWTSGSD
jgi:hypothetical protein